MTNLTNDAFADYAPDVLARRQVHRLPRADQRQREAVPARPRHEEEDAAHLRHPRRRGGPVPRRRHARLLVDRHRPGAADRPRRREERQHLQHLDAQPEDRRAEAVHRRARRQPLAGRPAATARATRSRSSATTRASTACTRSSARSRSRRRRRADFGAPGPVIDFQAPLQHTLVAENERKKKTFEKMFLEGRPPVNVGVTSGGDVFGGTADHASATCSATSSSTSSPRRSRSTARSPGRYVNLSRRFQYALQGFSQTQFFYGTTPASSTTRLSPVRQPRPRECHAHGAGRQRLRHLPVRPLPPRSRSPAASSTTRATSTTTRAAGLPAAVPAAIYGQQLFRNGTLVPLGVAFVQETTVFREFGPLAGNTMRAWPTTSRRRSATRSRARRSTATRATTCASPAAACWRCGSRGFKSWGDAPDFMYFGGNSEMRGYDYLQFVGQNAIFGNAELRFPLIEAMLTPIGVIGGVRGVFFATSAAAGSTGQDFTVLDDADRDATRRPDRLPASDDERQPRRRSTARRRPSPASGCATAARPTASASRPSRSASRSTSTGRGARCSTRLGRRRVRHRGGSASSASRGSGLDRLRLLGRRPSGPRAPGGPDP